LPESKLFLQKNKKLPLFRSLAAIALTKKAKNFTLDNLTLFGYSDIE